MDNRDEQYLLVEMKKLFLLEPSVIQELQETFVILNGKLEGIRSFFDKIQLTYDQLSNNKAALEEIKAKIDSIEEEVMVKGENQISIYLRKTYRLNKDQIQLIIQELWQRQLDVNRIHLTNELLKSICEIKYETVRFTNFDSKTHNESSRNIKSLHFLKDKPKHTAAKEEEKK